MITVIVPSYRNPKYLDLCLNSIVEYKTMDSTNVVVVMDGYVEESQWVMDKYPTVGFLPFEENMGMQYAINAGVMQATTEYVFVVNDDNVFPNRWDSRLIDVIVGEEILQYPTNWALTVNQIEPTGPGMFNFPVMDFGHSVDTFQYESYLENEQTIASREITQDGHIFPFVMRKKHFMAVGGFDTFYDSPNICDWDFFLKLELLGFVFPRTHALHLYHFGSVSTKKNSESSVFRTKEQVAVEQYMWKWGTPPYNQLGVNSKIPSNKQFRGFSV
jgi:GT2 family glycosyltransferase